MRRALGVGAVLVAALASCRTAAPPPNGFTLLFLGRSPAASAAGRSWAPDPDKSRILGFDGTLHVVRQLTNPRLATPMAVASLGNGQLLVTERTGEGVVLDTTGTVLREWDSPDVASLYAAWGSGRVLAARSPYYVPQDADPEADTAPLIRVLDTLGHETGGLAVIRQPALAILTHLVNAGAVATGQGGSAPVYFAPLVRDEIRKYTAGGQLAWMVKRGLFRHEADPVFLPGKGTTLRLENALVNVALVVGPDGRLYALGGDDSAATRLRVDVVDTATGTIVATRRLGPRESAVALDPRGRLVTFDGDSALAAAVEGSGGGGGGGGGGAGGGREVFAPAFALPDLHGDTVSLARFAGKVTLVNFWASWCDPCREEFPLMARLYREFDHANFEIAAISDDVDRGKMLAFAAQYHPPFPILVGGGRMKEAYHYRGLPYSLLLDRHGRIVERIFGFGGPEEFRELHETIAKEVRAP
ncbi:MAG TPA: TlpA disulfide reductase family protein [Gemmatimonadales bacterium]|nr:TlpA disulfide reductase family protein [Gemmatimonadales bacterium]